MGTTPRSLRLAIAIALCGAWGAAPARAQAPATSPLNCWWQTDKSAVRVGEPFGLTLTCHVMETPTMTVVPNFSDIEPTSIELTPFEMVEGTRREDIVSYPWRYVQYAYTVRLLGDEFFGRDVAIPATNVTYRIQTGGTETAEGTEHRYVLPAIPVRILSLVPAQAVDIQDPTADSFGDLEARRFRATVELVAASVLFGFAAVLVIAAGLRIRQHLRTRGPVVEQTVAVGAVLGGCRREVERVRAEALRDGWTSRLAAQALTPFRVAGAIALKQPVTQTLVAGDSPAREGQLALRHGLLRRRRAMVSAPITAETIDRLRAASNGSRPPEANRDVLDHIREALVALNVVRYGRERDVDVQMLDRTLENGGRALRRLHRARRLGIGTWRH